MSHAAPEPGGASASALGLLCRHRHARELLSKSQSTGSVREEVDGHPKRTRPQSAFSLEGQATRAAMAHFAVAPVKSPYAPGSSSSSSKRFGVSAKRPASAGACTRPSHASAPILEGTPVAMDERGMPRQGPHLLGNLNGKSPPPLPPLPAVLEKAASLARNETATTGSAGGVRFGADAATVHGGLADAPDTEFTSEELRLEAEVEQALRELEAADAAMAALRLQKENATEDAEATQRELEQLRGVKASWERAASDGQREIADREQRLEELAAVMSPDVGGLESADDSEVTTVAQREALECQQADLAAERVRVLEKQIARLEQQVSAFQGALQEQMEEKQGLAKQAESLSAERDQQRRAQREARAGLRAAEAQMKAKEDALAGLTQRRQILQRQAVKLKGETVGLRARITSAAAETACTPASASRAGVATPSRSLSTAPVVREAGFDGVLDESDDNCRAVSLRLQREIVRLWELMRCSDEEARPLQRLKHVAGVPVAAG